MISIIFDIVESFGLFREVCYSFDWTEYARVFVPAVDITLLTTHYADITRFSNVIICDIVIRSQEFTAWEPLSAATTPSPLLP